MIVSVLDKLEQHLMELLVLTFDNEPPLMVWGDSDPKEDQKQISYGKILQFIDNSVVKVKEY